MVMESKKDALYKQTNECGCEWWVEVKAKKTVKGVSL